MLESCHLVYALRNRFIDLLTGCSWPSQGPVHLLVWSVFSIITFSLKLWVIGGLKPYSLGVFTMSRVKHSRGGYLAWTCNISFIHRPFLNIFVEFVMFPSISEIQPRSVFWGDNKPQKQELDSYEINQILEYLIKWKNLPIEDSTWEDENFIHKHLELPKRWGKHIF